MIFSLSTSVCQDQRAPATCILFFRQNIMVKMNFAKLQVKLLEERDIRVINEGIIPEFCRTNSARLTAFRLDPVGAFKIAAVNADVDLARLLGPFVDDDHSIGPNDFKSQIKVGHT